MEIERRRQRLLPTWRGDYCGPDGPNEQLKASRKVSRSGRTTLGVKPRAQREETREPGLEALERPAEGC